MTPQEFQAAIRAQTPPPARQTSLSPYQRNVLHLTQPDVPQESVEDPYQGVNSSNYGAMYTSPAGGGAQSTVGSNISPEAQVNIDRGSSITGTPPAPYSPGATYTSPMGGGTQPPAGQLAATPAAPATPPASTSPAGGGAPATGTQPAPTAFRPPLALSGRPFAEQAQLLNNWLRDNGQSPQQFAIGGTSPSDPEINSLIDQVNNPNTPQSQYPEIAARLAHLISGRQSVTRNPTGGELFNYNAQTNTPERFTRTPAELIGDLSTPDQNTPTRTLPNIDSAQLQQLIGLMAKGGMTPEDRATYESQFVTDTERAALRRRQQTADALAASGLSGSGVSQRILEQAGTEDTANRISGLQSLRESIANRQMNARTTALNSILQQAGLASGEQSNISQNWLQRALAQANLAQGGEQFQQQLGLNAATTGVNQAQTEQQQRMNYVLALMQLENLVGEQDRGSIQQLINQVLSGATVGAA